MDSCSLNSSNYLEEAFKMRNLLEEFHEDHGVRPPTILGVWEHIFTGRLDRSVLLNQLATALHLISIFHIT